MAFFKKTERLLLFFLDISGIFFVEKGFLLARELSLAADESTFYMCEPTAVDKVSARSASLEALRT